MGKRKAAGIVRCTYEFIKSNQQKHDVRLMCRLLSVAPSGYYAWLKEPVSNHASEDRRLLLLIKASFTASHGIYGAPVTSYLELAEGLDDPAPALQQVDALQVQRKSLREKVTQLEREYAQSKTLAVLTEENMRVTLAGFAKDLREAENPHLAKSLIRNLVELVELDQTTLEAKIHYQMAVDSGGVSVAFPRGFEPLYSP